MTPDAILFYAAIVLVLAAVAIGVVWSFTR